MSRRFSFKRIAAFILICALLLAPRAANAGVADIISLLTTITGTIRNGIGSVLGGIQSIRTTVTRLEQQVVWPVAAINQAKSFVSQMRSQFTLAAQQVRQIRTESATLVNPSNLEKLLRGGQANGLAQIRNSYVQIYQPLPLANQATDPQRNLMDVDDSMAIGAMKTAVASDQATEQMLGVADGIERQAAAAAPGSAPMLTAQAQVANLQNQAMLQKMLAAELRQEAARLAHSNALRKQSVDATNDLRKRMQQILSRP
jgi:hypothetical protein